jgi:tetratricopeptide (TPR) repeat protein
MKTSYILVNRIIGIIMLPVILLQVSCKKDFLDAKPNVALIVPSTVADYQSILDNNTLSTLFNNNQPALNEIGAGDFYLTYTSWQGLDNEQERTSYLWSPDIFEGQSSFDWNDTYKRVLYENIVLDGIVKILTNPANQAGWNNVKGTALFYRAYDFLSLIEEFAKAYDPATASTDLGVPLRTTSDVNIKSTRASVQATYDLIISDLNLAKSLVPITPLFPTRPGTAAIYGLLSRVYLSQGNYPQALVCADSCLKISNKLLDFNTLSTSASYPFKRFSAEVIYHHTLGNVSAMDNFNPNLIADSVLYKSYNNNDLRKKIYFKTVSGFITCNASFGGKAVRFGGLTTNEMYLIRAECYARANNTALAMQDLNTLLKTRWITGTFVPYTAISSNDALTQILSERRKELVYRGLRWEDLKRLNKDPNTAVTLTRVFNGMTYTLPPNSNLYVFPIPPDEILASGIPQNPR